VAEDRVFTLIGNFQDNITGSLKKVNKSLDSVNKQLERMISLTSPIKQDFKEMSQYAMQFNRALAGQNANLRRTNTALRQHAREIGRVNRAYKAGGSRFMIQPTTGRSGGRGGGKKESTGMASAVGGAVLGTQIGDMMTSAIVAGFQAGVQIMVAPFRYIVNGMGERIRDEMSDVRAAGGLFAVNRLIKEQGKEGFVGSFREAEEVTKANNRYLAELAGSLPGDTQDYIQVSKQISDGIYRILAQDKENFMKSAAQYAREEGRIEQAQKIEAGGKEGMKAAGTEALGEITKLTVLAGLGGRQGAYGLPQLTERMFAQQDVSMGQMQRYAAIFRDPMIMGALERNIAKINETNANTADRMDAIRNMFKEIVTPELVARFRRTTEGVLESLRTTFLNPEVGLLGLGRPIKGVGKKLDDFGRYLDEQGNVVEDITQAASADISIFEGLRDSFAFLYQTLEPLVEIIPMMFDPLKDLGIELGKIRDVTASVFRRFNEYRTFFEELGGEFKDTARLRASMATLTQLFKDFGIFDKATFDRFQSVITTSTNFGADHAAILLKEMLDGFFESDLAESIGRAVGTLIGTVLKTVGDLAAQTSGIASSSRLAKGLSDGFDDANGREGIRLIFKSLIELVFKAVRELFNSAPFETTLVAGLALFGPTIASAIATQVGQKVVGALLGTAPATAGGAAAGGAAAGGAAAGGAAAGGGGLASVAAPAAVVAGFIIFDQELLSFANWLSEQATKLKESGNLAAQGFSVLVAGLSALIEGLTDTFKGAFDMIIGLFTGDIEKVKKGFVRMMEGIVKAMGGLVVSVIGIATTIGGSILELVKNLFRAIWEGIFKIKSGADNPGQSKVTTGSRSRWNKQLNRTEILTEDGWVPAAAGGSPGKSFNNLLAAANYEKKHMPSGASLAMANTSETIIPAAGGYGVADLIRTFKLGFQALGNAIAPSSLRQTQISAADLRYQGSRGGGGPVTVNAPITIHQQAGQDSQEVAVAVAREIGRAVEELQRSSLFT
jgi:hypothetical protein